MNFFLLINKIKCKATSVMTMMIRTNIIFSTITTTTKTKTNNKSKFRLMKHRQTKLMALLLLSLAAVVVVPSLRPQPLHLSRLKQPLQKFLLLRQNPKPSTKATRRTSPC